MKLLYDVYNQVIVFPRSSKVPKTFKSTIISQTFVSFPQNNNIQYVHTWAYSLTGYLLMPKVHSDRSYWAYNLTGPPHKTNSTPRLPIYLGLQHKAELP